MASAAIGSGWTAPDGTALRTVAWPSGDLIAAQRVSGAVDSVAATSALPSSAVTRVLFAVGGLALRIPPLRELAVRRLEGVQPKEKPHPRQYSWGRARAQWAEGTDLRVVPYTAVRQSRTLRPSP